MLFARFILAHRLGKPAASGRRAAQAFWPEPQIARTVEYEAGVEALTPFRLVGAALLYLVTGSVSCRTIGWVSGLRTNRRCWMRTRFITHFTHSHVPSVDIPPKVL